MARRTDKGAAEAFKEAFAVHSQIIKSLKAVKAREDKKLNKYQETIKEEADKPDNQFLRWVYFIDQYTDSVISSKVADYELQNQLEAFAADLVSIQKKNLLERGERVRTDELLQNMTSFALKLEKALASERRANKDLREQLEKKIEPKQEIPVTQPQIILSEPSESKPEEKIEPKQEFPVTPLPIILSEPSEAKPEERYVPEVEVEEKSQAKEDSQNIELKTVYTEKKVREQTPQSAEVYEEPEPETAEWVQPSQTELEKEGPPEDVGGREPKTIPGLPSKYDIEKNFRLSLHSQVEKLGDRYFLRAYKKGVITGYWQGKLAYRYMSYFIASAVLGIGVIRKRDVMRLTGVSEPTLRDRVKNLITVLTDKEKEQFEKAIGTYKLPK